MACRLVRAAQVAFYSGLTKIRTRRRAADSTHVTARRANAVLVFVNSLYCTGMPSVGNTFPAESAKSGRIRFFFHCPCRCSILQLRFAVCDLSLEIKTIRVRIALPLQCHHFCLVAILNKHTQTAACGFPCGSRFATAAEPCAHV